MSYAYDIGPVARAPASERAAFIRRTYGHLAGAILAFIALETVLLRFTPRSLNAMENSGRFHTRLSILLFCLVRNGAGGFRVLQETVLLRFTPGIENVVVGMLGVSWLFVLLAFMAVSWVAQYWARSGASPALQYLGLALYVVAEAIIFLPLLYIADHRLPGQHVIQTAGILTLTVFGGLTATVFITRKDFSFLGPILCIGGFIALGIILASLLLGGFNLGILFCFFMVALLSGYVLYHTSNVLYHYRTDQHVAASLALFSSIATLFWYILQIVMSSRD